MCTAKRRKVGPTQIQGLLKVQWSVVRIIPNYLHITLSGTSLSLLDKPCTNTIELQWNTVKSAITSEQHDAGKIVPIGQRHQPDAFRVCCGDNERPAPTALQPSGVRALILLRSPFPKQIKLAVLWPSTFTDPVLILLNSGGKL